MKGAKEGYYERHESNSKLRDGHLLLRREDTFGGHRQGGYRQLGCACMFLREKEIAGPLLMSAPLELSVEWRATGGSIVDYRTRVGAASQSMLGREDPRVAMS